MLSKNASPVIAAAFFTCFILLFHSAMAQQASFYFSAGYNKAWYSPSTLHVTQNELGNSYDLMDAKGDNKTHTPISALQLNYRLGYYCNDEQTLGIELNFDPANYRITDGQSVTLNGTVNNIPRVNKTIVFSAKNGYYYRFDGANLMLFNIVRRIGLYRSNNRKLAVDALIKSGVGPAMPHTQNSLPVDAVDYPGFQWGGWNAALETGFRVSVYRYGYVELAAKYDYAYYSATNVYDGSVSQHLNTYEAILSIGFTLPATRYNPLFYRQRIVTIIPIFVDKQDNEDKQNAQDSVLNMDNPPLTDIPEFPEIADRDRRRKYHDSMAVVIRNYDSLTTQQRNDSLANKLVADSLAGQLLKNAPPADTSKPAAGTDSAVNKGAAVNIDSVGNKMLQENNTHIIPSAAQPVLSDKDKKRQEKKARKDKKKLEKQQQKERKKKEQEDKKKQADKEAADNALKKEAGTTDSTGKN